MASVLTKMLAGEAAQLKVFEDDAFAAVLEPRPLARGHTVVFPKKEADALFDLGDPELSGLVLFAKKVARALKEEIPCRKIALVAYGLEVPHAHLHLIPAHGRAGETDLSRPRSEAAREDLAALAGSLRRRIKPF